MGTWLHYSSHNKIVYTGVGHPADSLSLSLIYTLNRLKSPGIPVFLIAYEHKFLVKVGTDILVLLKWRRVHGVGVLFTQVEI